MSRPTKPNVGQLVSRVALPRDTTERLWAHLERERRGVTIEADGYPNATMGGGTSGSGGDVTLTSVEAAVEIRLSGHIPRDDHRWHTESAWHDLRRIVALVDELLGHLRALDKLDKVTDPVDGECTNHASTGRKALTGPSRVAKERGLCDYCAEFADKHQGRRPPEPILERLAQGKRPTPQQIAWALGDDPNGITALGARLHYG